MEAGKNKRVSPIVRAISSVEKRTTGEIRVHISKSWMEKDSFAKAQSVFQDYGMHRTRYRNAVLIYVNLRKRRFALIGDEGIHREVGQEYWDGLTQILREDLQSTHFEYAISIAIRTLGATLQRYFPLELHEKSAQPSGQ